jgi:uncharacterized membrane protein
MDWLRQPGALGMAIFYVLAGLNHFRMPGFYIAIIPPALPAKAAINTISGLAEIILGLALLHPSLRPWAAWGVIALLVAVFPANVYHYTSGGAGMDIPRWVLAARLPLQALLIAWAWRYTKG